MTQNITEVLSKHGWPPATLLTLVVALFGIYFLYHDNQDINQKWEELSRQNLEINVKLLEHGQRRGELLQTFVNLQKEHTKVLQDIEKDRREQMLVDRQLTSFAVQALQQISDKVDITLQQQTPEDLIQQRK